MSLDALLLAGAVVLLLAVLSARLGSRLGLPSLLLFLALGMALEPFGYYSPTVTLDAPRTESAEDERLTVTVEPEDDAKTVQQGRFLWGVVYSEIAHQATIGGVRYTSDAWHEFFKREYLPRRKTKTLVAGRKRPVISTSLGTTKGLKIKPMSKYIEQVIAYAVTELGVQFSLTSWEDYRP